MKDPGNTTERTPDQVSRIDKIRAAVLETAELAVLAASAGDIEERMMLRSAVPMSIAELRHAATLLHNLTITLPEVPKENTRS